MSLYPRLLLATEDIALSRTLSWVLKGNNYDVVTAIGGPQFAERLDQEEYDLLILDIGTGDVGPMERLGVLRDGGGHRDLPLLLLAEADFDEARIAFTGLGAADIVHRPYRVRELLSRIKAHLRVGRELNRARAELRSRTELVEVLKEVSAALDPDQIYQVLVRRVAQALRINRCSVVLARAGDLEGTVVAAFENPTLRELRVEMVKYPEIQRALQSGETVLVNDVEQSPLYEEVRSTWSPEQVSMRTSSVIALPFVLGGSPAGVFFLRTTADDPPLNPIDLHFAEQVIAAAVTALGKAHAAHEDTRGDLRELADTDPLTGLPNRRVFDARLQDELDRARRYDQIVTVVLLDLDDFKRVNDTHGHAAGDRVLRQLGGMLRRELRTMDSIARIGGEEFAIILPETGGTGARIFVDRVLRRIALHNFGDAAIPIWVTASAGLATFPDDRAVDGEAILKIADENLYRAKHAGRNRYRD